MGEELRIRHANGTFLLCGLLTPAFTEQAFHGASECLQVFGGHGYIREWGIEQIVRDARVTMIYEGTNEIQAIDLLLRKVLADGGAAMCTLLESLERGLDGSGAQQGEVSNDFSQLRSVTLALAQAAKGDALLPYWVAGDYLRAAAIALLGWAWVRIGTAGAAADARWRNPRDAYRCWIHPEFSMRLGIIEAQIAQRRA